ncbi:hypothetical protein AAVH_28568 [Aphelenchoides avenae]|nr:hypothetical protein AAVH_28568 [Aphelenchus avenae]
MSFTVKEGNLACMQPDLPEWAGFALFDKSQRADRCMVTVVWMSEEADEDDDELPKQGENVFFTKWNPTLLTFDGNSLELFGGEGKRRQEKLTCAFQPVDTDGVWVKYDLEVVPKSDCGVRLNFDRRTTPFRGREAEGKADNATAPDHHAEL